MDQRTAVHTLARRYCQEQFSEWCLRYDDLQRRHGTSFARPEAYDTFPRYSILQAVLRSVEALIPESTASVVFLVEAMATAAQNSISHLGASPQNVIAERVIAAEKHLPVRHALSKEESHRICDELKSKWGADGGYWCPRKKKELPRGVLAFHTDYFDGSKEALLKDLLTRKGIARIWELREFGDDQYELESALFQPRYNGAEGYWTSAG